jgi:hypothetical protein
MSLINEALKKAQHLRTHSAGDAAPLPGDTGPIVRRGQPRSARSIVLMVCGGVVLVVLTAVGTVYFFNRPSAKPAPVVAFAGTNHKSAESDSPAAPTVVVPPITIPATVPAPPAEAPAPALAATAPTKGATGATEPAESRPTTPTETAKLPAATSAVPPETAVPATSTPPAPATGADKVPAKPDERIQAWVDAVKIAGIRPAGADSKVFMKDRLFRINDIVDRALSIRLLKVESDSITFSDANGVTYVKTF